MFSRLLMLLLVGWLLTGCVGNGPVIVDIEDPEMRSKYLEILSNTDLEYSIRESGEIIVKVDSIETLDKCMSEYYELRAERVRKLNEQLKTKQH